MRSSSSSIDKSSLKVLAALLSLLLLFVTVLVTTVVITKHDNNNNKSFRGVFEQKLSIGSKTKYDDNNSNNSNNSNNNNNNRNGSRKLWPWNAWFNIPSSKFMVWTHLNEYGGPYEVLFKPRNSDDAIPAKGEKLQDIDFIGGLNALREIVEKAKIDNKRLRAYGSRWSMNNIAYTDEYLVESWGLNYCKIGIDNDDDVTLEYVEKKERLVFVQSGVMIRHLHEWLLQAELALPTVTNPDGMRFVGAVLTGSHGSANQIGSMQDYVKAISIVIPRGHFLLQRNSDPVVTSNYASWLGNATLISDDALFDSALVSFGSFGLVHGMLIEAEPIYQLKMEWRRMGCDDPDFQNALNTLDVSALGLEYGSGLPFDFSPFVNPFTNDCYYRAFNKFRLVKGIPRSEPELSHVIASSSSAATTSNEKNPKTSSEPAGRVRGLTGAVTDFFLNLFLSPLNWFVRTFINPPLRFVNGVTVNYIIKNFFFNIQEAGNLKYPGEVYTLEGAELPMTPILYFTYDEMEIMVPSNYTSETVEIFRNVILETMIATATGIRYVAPSQATLAMSRYSPYTACISFVGYSILPGVKEAHLKVFDAMDASGIPYTSHWGKRLPPNNGDRWVNAYGNDLTEWKTQRQDFLLEDANMFSNECLEDFNVL